MPEKTVVNIRTANAGDAGVLANLGRQTFHETFAAQNKPEDMDAYLQESFTIEQLNTELAEPGAVYLLAEANAKVIGFAKVAYTPHPECITEPSPVRLVKLYVSADAIGSGVGAALMCASVDWAKKSGYKSLWLGVWEHNHRAKSFYERWGFKSVGTETFRLGRDDQTDGLMQLGLSEARPA
ncbi:MAG: GNAT family N-acetyltransferase [Planctomycetota bacterium]